jgi:hypothetical protein
MTRVILIAIPQSPVAKLRIESLPITTVYSDEVSSIHPVRDTIRFFKPMRRYRKL